MDILAHTLWVAAGVALVARRRPRPVPRAKVAATLGMAALPDLMHLLPIVAWWLVGSGSFAAVWGYAVAVPGAEPALPPLVGLLSHHLHCVMHSAPLAAAATLALWSMRPLRQAVALPLAGWWSHIAIDVFTHSADYYAVPVLYPFTERGFDGIAWTTPWFMALNYAALAAVGTWLAVGAWRSGRRGVAGTAAGSVPGRE